jgi:hypothetical protein
MPHFDMKSSSCAVAVLEDHAEIASLSVFVTMIAVWDLA